jgi:hypothetical protein
MKWHHFYCGRFDVLQVVRLEKTLHVTQYVANDLIQPIFVHGHGSSRVLDGCERPHIQ